MLAAIVKQYVTQHVLACLKLGHMQQRTVRVNCNRLAAMQTSLTTSTSSGVPYNADGTLHTRYLCTGSDGVDLPLFECNAECTCPPHCLTRTVQRGVVLPLRLVATKHTGWGVCCGVGLPRGTFVAEYGGDVVRAAAAAKREQDQRAAGAGNYIMCLQEYMCVHLALSDCNVLRCGLTSQCLQTAPGAKHLC